MRHKITKFFQKGSVLSNRFGQCIEASEKKSTKVVVISFRGCQDDYVGLTSIKVIKVILLNPQLPYSAVTAL
jgi:hypothetical protein